MLKILAVWLVGLSFGQNFGSDWKVVSRFSLFFGLTDITTKKSVKKPCQLFEKRPLEGKGVKNPNLRTTWFVDGPLL